MRCCFCEAAEDSSMALRDVMTDSNVGRCSGSSCQQASSSVMYCGRSGKAPPGSSSSGGMSGRSFLSDIDTMICRPQHLSLC